MKNVKIDGIRDNTVYLVGEEKLKDNVRCLRKEDPDGILFVTNTNIEGIFRYGYEQRRLEYFGHGPGYIWASRASCMNTAFDIALVEACYRTADQCTYTTCAIDLAHLEELIDEELYEIDPEPHISSDGEDTIYIVKLKQRGINE